MFVFRTDGHHVWTNDHLFGRALVGQLCCQPNQTRHASNDPLGQINSPASSKHYSRLKVVLFCEILKSAKIVITAGRDCGSASWINRWHAFVYVHVYLYFVASCLLRLNIFLRKQTCQFFRRSQFLYMVAKFSLISKVILNAGYIVQIFFILMAFNYSMHIYSWLCTLFS